MSLTFQCCGIGELQGSAELQGMGVDINISFSFLPIPFIICYLNILVASFELRVSLSFRAIELVVPSIIPSRRPERLPNRSRSTMCP